MLKTSPRFRRLLTHDRIHSLILPTATTLHYEVKDWCPPCTEPYNNRFDSDQSLCSQVDSQLQCGHTYTLSNNNDGNVAICDTDLFPQ